MCYGMITYAVESNEQFEDAKKRIHDMTECYREQTRNRSLTQTDSNAGFMTVDTNEIADSQQVKSPLVVRGKGRPPSLRRASRMEIDMRKVKAKQKKAQVRGKLKQRHESSNLGDTPAMGTRRNLFGPSEVGFINPGQVQPVIDSSIIDTSGIQHRETIFLDSMAHDWTSLDCDGSQPVQPS
ncbi:hypothetical protein F2P56_013118 [Juglans regia]|uniref:Uncharacterized protein n=1 Tax=Juglans regia TaxID=51240 RepID=A0A833XKZ9_JUGRE|nr:hypothetical protein F2P56_013118 [Juglans regia]